MKARPAETAGAAAGTVGLAAGIATHDWLAVGVACIGYVPAIVTWLVNHGGIRGALGALWRGRS